jgi:two-component system phosphate regulon sensor histidine kinase PhoR
MRPRLNAIRRARLALAAALTGRSGEAADGAAFSSLAQTRRGADERAIATAISGLPDPAIVLERDEIVLAFNAAAQRFAPALAAGAPISFALRNPDLLAAIRQARASGTAQRVEFSERVPADRRWEATATPVSLDGPGGPRALLVLAIRDLTPLRLVEEMRADFVANASHELRTPLASLSGFIDTLQGPAREDAVAREKFLAIMKEQAGRMARLIDDLLSLSRIELRAHLHPDTPVDLAAILRQVADGLQALAQSRDVAIAIDLPSGAWIVAGDRDELLRAFENLVENALKYGASGRRVDIALARVRTPQGEEAVASIRDYGPGIAPEHLPRLTERFYRVDVGESRAQGGTGLGLSLVKHTLQRHRGRLTIDSRPGAGATFAARLPLAPGEAQAELDSASKPAR